jgi:cell division protein ZapA (FtsZ GTPase activity inhibitor)
VNDSRTRVTVEIFGLTYTLTGHSSPDYMRQVAERVDDRMRKIAEIAPRLDLPRVAVLTAVNFADEYLRCARENEQLHRADLERRRLEEEVRTLRGQLEETTRRAAEEANVLRARLEEETARVREEYERQLEELVAAHAAETGDLKARYEREIEKLAGEREEIAAREREWAALRKWLEGEVDRLGREAAEARRLAEERELALRALEREGQERHRRLEARLQETEALRERTETLERELEAERKKHAALQEEYAKLKTEFNEWIDMLEQQ